MTKLMPWVGGKAQLMWAIQMLLPTHYKTLVDVFGGSGIITMNTSVLRQGASAGAGQGAGLSPYQRPR